MRAWYDFKRGEDTRTTYAVDRARMVPLLCFSEPLLVALHQNPEVSKERRRCQSRVESPFLAKTVRRFLHRLLFRVFSFLFSSLQELL